MLRTGNGFLPSCKWKQRDQNQVYDEAWRWHRHWRKDVVSSISCYALTILRVSIHQCVCSEERGAITTLITDGATNKRYSMASWEGGTKLYKPLSSRPPLVWECLPGTLQPQESSIANSLSILGSKHASLTNISIYKILNGIMQGHLLWYLNLSLKKYCIQRQGTQHKSQLSLWHIQ